MLRVLVLFILVLLLTAVFKFQTSQEGMSSLEPTDYSSQNNISDDGLLLKGFYRTKENPGVSQHSSADRLRLFPKTTMSSYEQKTNNKRHWFTPCDGSSMRSDMCGGLYKGKALKKHQNVVPSMTSGRVNMYDAAEF
jgi:hypothetical protein